MEAGDPTGMKDGAGAVAPLDVSVLSLRVPPARPPSRASSSSSRVSSANWLKRPLSSSTLFRVELFPANRVGYLQGLPPGLAESEAEINVGGAWVIVGSRVGIRHASLQHMLMRLIRHRHGREIVFCHHYAQWSIAHDVHHIHIRFS